jgi:hypothetical protein
MAGYFEKKAIALSGAFLNGFELAGVFVVIVVGLGMSAKA